MLRIALAVSAAVLIVIAGGLLMLAPGDDVAEIEFPERLEQDVIFLPPSDAGELNRIATFGEDGFTRVSEIIYFVDGSEGYVYYHPDGKAAREFGIRYPEVDGIRHLKMEAAYALDGRTYLWRNDYRRDGSLEIEAVRLASGQYRVRSFFEDGVTMAELELFDAEGKLEHNARYTLEGVVTHLFRINEDGSVETIDYTDAGVRVAYHNKNDRMGTEFWEQYFADGERVKARFELTKNGHQFGHSYEIVASYFEGDGSLNHRRRFSRTNMYVMFYDQDGEVRFTQRWILKASTERSLEPDVWMLDGVQMYDIKDYTSMEPSYWFHVDGSLRRHVYPVTINDGKVRNEIKVYDQNGHLIEHNKPKPDGSGREIIKYEPGESDERLPGALPEELVVQHPYLVPPIDVPESVTYNPGGR